MDGLLLAAGDFFAELHISRSIGWVFIIGPLIGLIYSVMHSEKRNKNGYETRALKIADELIESGNNTRARKIIEGILEKRMASEYVFEEAYTIFWAADMLDEARMVFRKYEARFGKKLKGDFLPEEFDEWEKNSREQIAQSQVGGVWVFKERLPWPAIFFDVIREVQLSKKGLSITYKKNKIFLGWDEISSVKVKSFEDQMVSQRLSFIARGKEYFMNDMAFKNGHIMIKEAFPKFVKIKKVKNS